MSTAIIALFSNLHALRGCMPPRTAAIVLAAGAFIFSLAECEPGMCDDAKSLPNIVVILADDKY